MHMHTNVILTNKRRTHAQCNYTNTKLKAWFRRLLRHPARKRSGSIRPTAVHPGPTQVDTIDLKKKATYTWFVTHLAYYQHKNSNDHTQSLSRLTLTLWDHTKQNPRASSK